MQIAFVLLAHQRPDRVGHLISMLTAAGHSVVIHYDLNASDDDYAKLTLSFEGHAGVRFAQRIRVGWGHWSIVQAVLNCVDVIEEAGWQPDYVYHISGSDYPIKSSTELVRFLTRNKGKEFIEGVPANKTIWVKGGPQQERYLYRHHFNWRTRKRWGEAAMKLQKVLRLERSLPEGLEPYIGSQWWVLTWSTLRAALKLGRMPHVVKFFRTTLIPDELYMQTLVHNLVPKSNIVSRPLTFYQFTDYMVPIVFCADKVEFLVRQPFFFARKMSLESEALVGALDLVWEGRRPAQSFKDSEIGLVGPEYEATRLRQRNGLPGTHVAGKVSNDWSGHLEWLRERFFAVIGSTRLELKFAQMLLSAQSHIVLHGQLFDPANIGFKDNAKTWGVYKNTDLALRNESAPDFLADVIRLSHGEMTGFLLQSGHGWHLPEVLFEHPFAHLLVVHGDPLIGLLDALHEIIPASVTDPSLIAAIPPRVLRERYEESERTLAAHNEKFKGMIKNARQKGDPASWSWLMEVDLNLSQSPKIRPKTSPPTLRPSSNWVEATLDRWRGWLSQAKVCLALEPTAMVDSRPWELMERELRLYDSQRRILVELLSAAGVTDVVI